MLQLAVHWTGQSQLDEAPPRRTGLAAAKASSGAVKVAKGEEDVKFVVQSRHREPLILEKLLQAMAVVWGTEEFLKNDDFSIFLSSDLSFVPLDFKVGPSLQPLRQVQQCNLGNSKENLGLVSFGEINSRRPQL